MFTALIYKCLQKVSVCPLQLSLIFAIKDGALLSGAHFRCPTSGRAPCLTHKHESGLERPMWDEHLNIHKLCPQKVS